VAVGGAECCRQTASVVKRRSSLNIYR
jgi:hypothetical protein